jgi:zinc transporter ZupT
MRTPFWISLLASMLAAAVTAAGILVIRRFEPWARRNATHFVCFAAGVLITAAFLHIVPKALSMNRVAPAFLVLGFFALHLINRFVTSHVCERDPGAPAALGVVPLIGIGFHSFLDGAIYSITFAVGVFTGLLAGAGMVLHEFPEGVITYLLLVRSGYDQRKALWLALIAAGLSTPFGMLVSFPFVSRIGEPLLGALLAVSAGALVYVGATHLLPQAEKEPRRYALAALGGGILVAVAIVLAEPG